MNECFGNHFIHNGEMKPSVLFDNSLVYEGDSVYEVLRVKKGFPYFFYDHMERLETSVRLQNKINLSDPEGIKSDILKLTRSERIREINLKIVYNYNNDESNYLVYYIQPSYPSSEQYRNGVRAVLYNAERKDPESKVINHKLRSSIYQTLILDGAYEALLVNRNDYITEGSRSNLFFIIDDKLITAPHNMVLGGITRKYILDICSENNIKVELRCARVAELKDFDSAIMTGTSPMVLPYCSIDNQYYDVTNPMIERLRKLYVAKAEESIRNFLR
jgi:branched-chain amino acid aminotransferase